MYTSIYRESFSPEAIIQAFDNMWPDASNTWIFKNNSEILRVEMSKYNV